METPEVLAARGDVDVVFEETLEPSAEVGSVECAPEMKGEVVGLDSGAAD